MYSNECYLCDCYDPDREDCLMSSVDRAYACPYSPEYEEYDEKAWGCNNVETTV